MDVYQGGDLVRLSVTFTNAAGVAADPTDVQLKYENPAGTETTVEYNPGDIVKDSTGNFHYDLSVPSTGSYGTWTHQWIGTGAVQQVVHGTFYVQPSTFEANLTGWNELRERVYVPIRDSSRTSVTEDQVDIYLREAMEDLSSRLRLIHGTSSGTTSGSTITLPSDYVDLIWLKVAREGTNDDYVAWVDQDTFNTYQEADLSSDVTLGRVFANTVELYPTPDTGSAYTLRYWASSTSDLSGYTPILRQKLVNYARAHALYKMNEFTAGDRYLAIYEDGLPGINTQGKNRQPGPISLYPASGVFDEAWNR